MPTSEAQPVTSPQWIVPVAIVALVFGLMTIFSGGSVLLAPLATRGWAGNIVGFVVWFNFLAGFAYVVAAIGLWRRQKWAAALATLIALSTALIAMGFAVVVLRGAAFEMRTVGALTLRFLFWAVIAIVARRAVMPA